MTMPETSLPQPPVAAQPTTREQVRDIKDQAFGQARDTLREARDRATSSLGESKNRVANQVGEIASAFREVSGQLRSHEQSRIAGLTESLAGHADQVASYLRDRDGETMLRDVEQLARRQPALVIGGALAIGLAAGRFLKSSGHRRRDDEGYGGMHDGD